jgi:hypothetical protein
VYLVALRQIAIKIIALQWIFAFVVFGMFLAVSLYISTARVVYISKVLEKVIKKRAGLTQGQPTQTISKDIILMPGH